MSFIVPIPFRKRLGTRTIHFNSATPGVWKMEVYLGGVLQSYQTDFFNLNYYVISQGNYQTDIDQTLTSYIRMTDYDAVPGHIAVGYSVDLEEYRDDPSINAPDTLHAHINMRSEDLPSEPYSYTDKPVKFDLHIEKMANWQTSTYVGHSTTYSSNIQNCGIDMLTYAWDVGSEDRTMKPDSQNVNWGAVGMSASYGGLSSLAVTAITGGAIAFPVLAGAGASAISELYNQLTASYTPDDAPIYTTDVSSSYRWVDNVVSSRTSSAMNGATIYLDNSGGGDFMFKIWIETEYIHRLARDRTYTLNPIIIVIDAY